MASNSIFSLVSAVVLTFYVAERRMHFDAWVNRLQNSSTVLFMKTLKTCPLLEFIAPFSLFPEHFALNALVG